MRDGERPHMAARNAVVISPMQFTCCGSIQPWRHSHASEEIDEVVHADLEFAEHRCVRSVVYDLAHRCARANRTCADDLRCRVECVNRLRRRQRCQRERRQLRRQLVDAR
jgi:hypothetical protein